MRTLKKVRKLSHDNFVESYGVMSRSKSADGRGAKKRSNFTSNSNELVGVFRRRESHSSIEDDYQHEVISNGNASNCNYNNNVAMESHRQPQIMKPQRENFEKSCPNSPIPMTPPKSEPRFRGPAGRRLRKFSLKKFPSTGDIHKAVTRRTNSEGETKEGQDTRDSLASGGRRITSWHSQFSLNRLRHSSPSFRTPNPKRSMYRIPATQMSIHSHKGYLDRRNKKKQWERYWCVVHDSCLYFYHSPQSEFTQDPVVLRGCEIIADISDVERFKFTFKLEKSGSQLLHFRCDTHSNFMIWITTLQKEAKQFLGNLSDVEILKNSVQNCQNYIQQHRREEQAHDTTPQTTASSPTTTESQEPTPPPKNRLNARRHTADNIFQLSRRDHLNLEIQKENLLREVLAQQQEIIKERDEIISPKQNRPYYIPLVRDACSPKPSRDEVIEKYERVRENQERKILKSLTQLNRRRNSVQLKIDQLSRDLGPKFKTSRNVSRYVIQSMEARLAMLQAEIAEVDQEIREQHTTKEDLVDNINQKRDLEIMVLDQQETIDIVKRHQRSNNNRYVERGRRCNRGISSRMSQSHEHLTSIDEISTLSDSSSTSSGLSNCGNNKISPNTIRTISSTPRHRRTPTALEEIGHEQNLDRITPEDEDSYQRCHMDVVNKSSSCSSDADEIMSQGNSSVEGALSDDFRTLSTSSYSDLDADVISRNRVSSSDESIGKKSNEIRPGVLAEIEEFEVFSKMMLKKLSSSGQC